MMLLGFITIISVVTQNEPVSSADATTYVITLADGTVVYGMYTESGDQATYQIDAPWESPPPSPTPTLRSKIADVRQELRHKREERREREAREAGYARVVTADGERYVSIDVMKRAKRAAAMAEKIESQLGSDPAPSLELPAEATAPKAAPRISLLRRYGFQVGIIIAGLAIALILAKVLVVPKAD